MADNQQITGPATIVSSPWRLRSLRALDASRLCIVVGFALGVCSCQQQEYAEQPEPLFLSCSGMVIADIPDTLTLPLPMTFRFKIDALNNAVGIWMPGSNQAQELDCTDASSCSLTVNDETIQVKVAEGSYDFNRVSGELNFTLSDKDEKGRKQEMKGSLMTCSPQSEEEITAKAF